VTLGKERNVTTTDPQGSGDRGIQAILDDLIQASGCKSVLVITKIGTALAEAGDTSYMNTTAMAALVAGMFTATREVARMVGEQQFSILLQQGATRHIHISLVTDSTMMVIVFEDYQRIGRVRLEARKAGDLLAPILASTQSREQARKEISVPEFKEYAFNLIDSIFVSKGK
jgi:predicted regulator of Ras-like GTPase activity (Roadblock/LC7/MglB family)